MDREHLLQIAVKQRQFIFLFVGLYLITILRNVLNRWMDGLSDQQAMLLLLPLLGYLVFILGCIVVLLVILFQLMTALQYHIVTRILFLIVTIVPCVNLLILLAVNGRATNTLRSQGIDVGLVGASKRAIEALRREGPPPLDPYERT